VLFGSHPEWPAVDGKVLDGRIAHAYVPVLAQYDALRAAYLADPTAENKLAMDTPTSRSIAPGRRPDVSGDVHDQAHPGHHAI
jgi:hypothetical protein